jgi:hypothetical protein
LPHQRSYGDWEWFFENPGDGRWGGTWGIGNPASRRILLKEIQAGDLILAYQTDRRAAIGICEVLDLAEDQEGETEIFLKPIERLARPVDILSLKRSDPSVAEIRAFRQGQVQTLYETSQEEARTLLEVCGASVQLDVPDDSTEEAMEKLSGGGFGSYEQNLEVERGAVDAVRGYYTKRGWRVRSVERRHIGYDLHCTRHGERDHHVEVKGTQGGEMRFMVTAGEVDRAKTDSQFYLALVTNALQGPQINIWCAREFLSRFRLRPLSFMAEFKENPDG